MSLCKSVPHHGSTDQKTMVDPPKIILGAVTQRGMGEVLVSQPHLPSLRQPGDQSQGLADLRDRSDGGDSDQGRDQAGRHP